MLSWIRSKLSGEAAHGPPVHDVPMFDGDLRIDRLQQDFDEKMDMWRQSTCRATLLDLIDRSKPSDGWRIDKILCLGTGSFCFYYEGTRPRSMLQFACAVDIANELRNPGPPGGSTIQIFAQDPKYRQLDVDLLTRLGVEHLETVDNSKDFGAAKDHLGPRTLLFEFFLPKYRPMFHDLYTAVTAMQVGTGTEIIRELGCSRRRRKVLKRFDEEHDCVEFPWCEENPYAFFPLKVHWPK